MKKICLFLVMICMITLFSGCTSKEYQLITKGGSYYIKLNKELESSDSNSDTDYMRPVPKIQFDSFEEMISDIQNGNFTEEEMRQLACFDKDADGNILVCDLDTLLSPLYPDDYEYFWISWYGDSYAVGIRDTDASKVCNITFLDEDEWQYDLSRAQRWSTGLLRLEVTSTEPDLERNGTIYYFPYVTFASDDTSFELNGRKGCIYSFEQNGNSYIVREYYESDAADAIPSSVRIWGISQGQRFRVFIDTPDERPSMDWIAQFGFENYSPNTDSN